MGFYDAFFGSDQSQYTAYAIVAAIIAICITILLTATDVPISNRLLIVFFVIISLIPSVFLTLFELTCIVTGGTEPNKWWCYAFAWILAAFIIIYCIFIVIISLISLFTYNNAINNLKESENKDRLTQEVSNNYAKQIIETDEKREKHIEKFYAEMEEKNNNEIASSNENNTNNEIASSDENIEEFVYGKKYRETPAEKAAKAAAEEARQKRLKLQKYYDDLAAAQARQARSSLPQRKIKFTDYGSINSDEDVEDSKYFSYDDFKKD
jgi:hypothetical protein